MRKSLITIGLAAASLATIAGLTACGGSSAPVGQAAPRSTPAAARPVVPMLRVGKTVTVRMPSGADANDQPQFVTEKWTLNSANVVTPSDTSGTYVVMNVTIVNEGPQALQGSNSLLGYADWYFDTPAHQVTPVDAGTGNPYSDVPSISDVAALSPGQSTTGQFSLTGPVHKAGTYEVTQRGTATPVMIIDPASA